MTEAIRFTDAQKSAFRSAFAPAGATDAQWELFIGECERRALIPGKDVVFQLRTAKEWNADLKQNVFVKKVTFITTIGALRLIAQRDGRYEGHGPFIYYYGAENGDLKESKIPLGKRPHAVSVEGYRKDWRVPLFATARYDAYVQLYGKSDEEKRPTQMWATRGEEQLAKCCEAGMLRTVAPEECSGLIIGDELESDGAIDKEETTTVALPQSTVAPQVNQKADARVEVIRTSPFPQMTALQYETKVTEIVNSAPVTVPPVVEAPKPASMPESTPQASPVAPLAIVEPALPAVPPAEGPIPVQNVDAPATRQEFEAFLARAAKLVRDKLPKEGLKEQEASLGVKNYLLKGSGKSGFKQIDAATFEKLIKTLEDAPPGSAAEIVRGMETK